MIAAVCARCTRPIPFATDDNIGDPDTECTSTFVGEHERELHWKCFVAESGERQMVLA